MLTPDMDIEADLGIDSIKRVEILSAMEERMPNLPTVSPEVMAELNTLGQIAGYLSGKTELIAPDPSIPAPSLPAPLGAMPSPEAKTGIKRQVITVAEAAAGQPVALYRQGKVRVWGTGALAPALCQALKRRGIACQKACTVSELEDVDGLILAADSMASTLQATADLTSAFAAAKTAAPALMAAARTGSAFFTTVTQIDGGFGVLGAGIENPYAGALAALAKTAALEWENVVCRAIDLDPAWDLSAAVEAAAEEILTEARGPVEVGLSRNHRRVLALVPAKAPAGTLALSEKDVVVVTGGARGVTAAAAIALAEASGTSLALLGRSPAPEPEPGYLQGLTDEGALKRAILKHLPPDKATPADLARVYRAVVANREIDATLHRLAAMKVRAGYYSVDVRDASALSEVLDTVRNQLGAISGIIHGAGVLEDRRIVDKTVEQFDRVFSTKVQGLENLLSLTTEDALSYIVLFSSVSARFGNIGQADYAMANEVLNKMARREALARPHCRVVSINWGPWDGGMVSASLKREFSRKGIDLIPLEAGARAMVTEMAQPAGAAVEVVLGAGLIPDPPAETARFSEAADLNLALKREIDVHRLPVLDAHRLDGKPVVPFALITEWLGNGALHENPGLVFQGMDDIRLLKGIRIGKDPKLIRLMAGKARKNGSLFEVDVEIRNGVSQGLDVIHSRARAILGAAPAVPPEFSMPVIANGTPYPRTVKEAYEKVLFHGHPLRGIREIIGYSEKGLVAKIASAPAPAAWMREPLRSRWIADPLVLDSAFQMAILWCYEKMGSVCLPSYASAYRQYCQQFPENGVTAVFQVTEACQRKMTGAFTFLDTAGQVVATLSGYEAIMDPTLISAFKTKEIP
jgi:NAD(P)-dependent dehydrogenase (short-subunit alcohol dehydrogenase family)